MPLLEVKNFKLGRHRRGNGTSHEDKVNDLTHEQEEKGKRKREEKIGKERANKTARVMWGRGKREANGK